ncbi:hypothetical protein RvY_17783 [Ramazzottius varieornatus]|uniref:Cep192-like domain-containing protein n=1 Tax=Ramazzottius varieornatus TaxID=947166 RepID=A0A1D1W3E1_RAMVA|nr:hypothetical protein RvY_17783 [Ramazzottius varieornatus]
MEAGYAGLAENINWNFLSNEGPFSNPTNRSKSIGDGSGYSFGHDFADPHFANIADQLAHEDFFDAADVLGGRQNLYDIKFAPNPDLDKSGLHHEAHVPRTDSMSPKSEDECLSVNGYFQRRSAYSCNREHPDDDYLSCLSKGDKEELDFDGNVVEERRSTLTKHDLFRIIEVNDANRVRKQKGPSSVCSSTSTSRSSSIGTVAALAVLDRILDNVSSDDGDESLRPSIIPPKMTRSEPVLPTITQQGTHFDRAVRFDAPSSLNKSPKAVAKQRLGFATSTPAIKDTGRPFANLMKERPQQASVQDGNETVFLGNKTEEILRRANNVLERIGRMKENIKESEEHDMRRHSSHQPRPSLPPPLRNEPRLDRPHSPEPSSHYRPRNDPRSEPSSAKPRQSLHVSMKSIEIQTDSEHTSINHDVSNLSSGYQNSTLLEQTTYPIPRSSAPKRDLCVATHRIFFPPTEVGESSSAKLQIKNYTSQVYQLQFSFLTPTSVFQNRYDNINIQPRRFLNLPLRFVPTETGYWETKVKIVGRPGEIVMVVDLVGEGIMGIRQH